VKKNKNLIPNFFHVQEEEFNEKTLDTKYRQIQSTMDKITRLEDEYVRLKEKLEKVVSKTAVHKYSEAIHHNRAKLTKHIQHLQLNDQQRGRIIRKIKEMLSRLEEWEAEIRVLKISLDHGRKSEERKREIRHTVREIHEKIKRMEAEYHSDTKEL